MIFITADLHFNHPGIIELERHQFKSIEEHNKFIVERYNSVVGVNDTCYILGDVGFYEVDELAKWINQLNGNKILIRGNHDTFTEDEAKYVLGFKAVCDGPKYIYCKKGKETYSIILSHEPALEAFNNPYTINIHGHLHNSKLDLPNYYNVNIAQTNYLPQSLEVFKKQVFKKCKTRRETFQKEWYADFYQFNNPVTI